MLRRIRESGGGDQERREQPPPQQQRHGICCRQASVQIIIVTRLRGAESSLDIGESMLQPAHVISIEQRPGEHLQLAIPFGLQLFSRQACLDPGGRIIGQMIEHGGDHGFFVADVPEDQPLVHP